MPISVAKPTQYRIESAKVVISVDVLSEMNRFVMRHIDNKRHMKECSLVMFRHMIKNILSPLGSVLILLKYPASFTYPTLVTMV